MSDSGGNENRGRGSLSRYAGYAAVFAFLAMIVIYSQSGTVSWLALGATAVLGAAAVVLRGK